MSLKARVEAALFLTDKPLAAAVIAQLVNVDVQMVRQAILELIHDYEERNSALEIADDGGYMMQVKDEYATLANDLAPIDLPVSIVRTLSAIAIKQPVLQSEIVRIRGAGAYDHIKELLEKELITKKEEGRSSLLNTTKKFQEYFRLSQDAKALRDQLKDQSKIEPSEQGTEQEAIPEFAIPEEAPAVFEQVNAAAEISSPESGSAESISSESTNLESDAAESESSETSNSESDGAENESSETNSSENNDIKETPMPGGDDIVQNIELASSNIL